MANFKEVDFIKELNALNILTYTNLSTNDSYTQLHKNFLFTLNKHAPIKYLSKKARKTKQKPWLTKGILTSIAVKRKLFTNYKQTQNENLYLKYKNI